AAEQAKQRSTGSGACGASSRVVSMYTRDYSANRARILPEIWTYPPRRRPELEKSRKPEDRAFQGHKVRRMPARGEMQANSHLPPGHVCIVAAGLTGGRVMRVVNEIDEQPSLQPILPPVNGASSSKVAAIHPTAQIEAGAVIG